jgi:hypothetical protein
VKRLTGCIDQDQFSSRLLTCTRIAGFMDQFSSRLLTCMATSQHPIHSLKKDTSIEKKAALVRKQHPIHSLKKDTSIEKKAALVRNYSEALQKRRK